MKIRIEGRGQGGYRIDYTIEPDDEMVEIIKNIVRGLDSTTIGDEK